MKRKFSWKALLALALVLCFAVCMIACDPEEEEPAAPESGQTMAAIDALLAGLDKTIPSGLSDKTSQMSVTADIAVDSDLAIYDDQGEVLVNLGTLIGDKPLDIDLKLAANLDATNNAKNVIDVQVLSGGKTVANVFSKNNVAYITDGLTVETENPVTYKLDASSINYNMYVDDLPGMLGKLLAGINVADLKESIVGLIDQFSLGPFLDKIVEAKKENNGYELRVILAAEQEGYGLAGTSVAGIADSALGNLLTDPTVAGIVNKIVPYVLGASLKDINTGTHTKEQLNDVRIKFDTDATSGAITDLTISIKSGSQVKTTKGGLTLTISNLSLTAGENTAVSGKEAPANAVPLGAELKVGLDLGYNPDLSLTATLQVAPALDDSQMKMSLKSVALKIATAVFNEDDLCAEYALVDGKTDTYALKVDLTALYKVAYKTELAGGATLESILSSNGIRTTQYYFEINAGEFLTNIATKKYVLVGMAGTGSHGVYEYVWLDSVTADTTVEDIAKELVKDTALVDQIYKAYKDAGDVSYDASKLELVVADTWEDGKTIKYVMAYPTSVRKTITFKNGDTTVATVNGTIGDSVSEIAAKQVTSQDNKVFTGWNGIPESDKLTEDVTLTANFIDATTTTQVDVYKYNLGSKSYVKDSTQNLAHGAIAITPETIYGMTFDGWYSITSSGAATKVTEINATTKAIYPVYVSTNKYDEEADDSGDAPLVAEGDDQMIVDVMTKKYYSVDVMGLIIGNVGTILNVLETQTITMDQVVDVVSGIDMLGITGTDAEKETAVANWIGYLIALAEVDNSEFNYFQNFYYSADKPVTEDKEDITAQYLEETTLDTQEAIVAYMSNLTKYTAYYRFVGKFGSLTESVKTDWNYGWTSEQWTDYSELETMAEKANKYKEVSAAQGIKVNATAINAIKNYDELAMSYVNAYLGNTGCTSLKSFLFDKELKIALSAARDASGFKVNATLTRGTDNAAVIDLQFRLIDGSTVVKVVNHTTWDTKALDFRAWDMSLIKNSAGEAAINTTDWTSQDYVDFATQCIVKENVIVFRGVEYAYDRTQTKFVSAAVSALEKLNIKLTNQG